MSTEVDLFNLSSSTLRIVLFVPAFGENGAQ